MIYAIVAVILVITFIVTKLANRATVRPGFHTTLSAIAIGFWLLSVAAIICAVVYYLNTHGIHFTPKPITLTTH